MAGPIIRHTNQYPDAYWDVSYYVPPHQYTPAEIEMDDWFEDILDEAQEEIEIEAIADPIAHRDIVTAFFNAANIEYPKKKKTLAIVALFISIPMEYMRMYQEQVATKVAHMKGGIPKECVPEEMNFMKTVKHWISWELSWIHEPCEKYHKALMVDPMYEISPLNVLWSVLVRGVLHPIELLFSSVGKCLKLFFNEIPAQWQLLMFVLMVVVVVVVIMAACNYRLSLPFVKIEPKTPVTSPVTSGQRCGSIGGDTPRKSKNSKLCS
uniref:Chloride channel CLIC-like protein 1 n=1 Tax=Magallana gigas TaxID=29159 RepID=K1QEA3_MAGGI